MVAMLNARMRVFGDSAGVTGSLREQGNTRAPPSSESATADRLRELVGATRQAQGRLSTTPSVCVSMLAAVLRCIPDE